MSRAGGGSDLDLPELLSAEDIAKIQESVEEAVNKGNDQIAAAVEEVLRLPSNTINEAEEVVQNMLFYINTVTEAEEFISNAINEAEEVVQDMLLYIKTVTEAEEVMSNAINEAEEIVQDMLFFMKTVTEAEAEEFMSRAGGGSDLDLPELLSAEDIKNEKVAANMIKAP
mmetsp:Transcript_4553/g.6650  ORF Transcript_4553/g.6650 Transcript_4553/m.6650 type:complete len:170 (+) Transcript_4553:1-510(+)